MNSIVQGTGVRASSANSATRDVHGMRRGRAADARKALSAFSHVLRARIVSQRQRRRPAECNAKRAADRAVFEGLDFVVRGRSNGGTLSGRAGRAEGFFKVRPFEILLASS